MPDKDLTVSLTIEIRGEEATFKAKTVVDDKNGEEPFSGTVTENKATSDNLPDVIKNKLKDLEGLAIHFLNVKPL